MKMYRKKKGADKRLNAMMDMVLLEKSICLPAVLLLVLLNKIIVVWTVVGNLAVVLRGFPFLFLNFRNSVQPSANPAEGERYPSSSKLSLREKSTCR